MESMDGCVMANDRGILVAVVACWILVDKGLYLCLQADVCHSGMVWVWTSPWTVPAGGGGRGGAGCF